MENYKIFSTAYSLNCKFLTSVTFGKFAGVIILSTFSNINILEMHDVIDPARPNHPINSPVV